MVIGLELGLELELGLVSPDASSYFWRLFAGKALAPLRGARVPVKSKADIAGQRGLLG